MDFEDILDLPTLDNISAALELRPPNREAVETIAMELGRHYDLEKKTELFEGVVDSATGVGKTYIFAAALEYLAQVRGVRDFVLIAPSKTILQKTVDQFTVGNPKSIIGALPAPITLVTSENFATPTIAAAMEDDALVKLYVFTVQSLIKPTSKSGRRTHEFQEGLGSGFYERLKSAPFLTVFADEHHAYYGEKFSEAVRALDPWALIGLTATPSKKTPEDQVIFRYPLAAAIADRYVKTPVIVGRKDDRHDPTTKLMDGVGLLERKREIADSYADAHGLQRINSIMLVVASTVDEAEEWAAILRSDDFLQGAYTNAVLVVHSDVPADTEAEAKELRRLADVEDPDSPTRVIVSVSMLKEGWDVKNVYVLLSTRPMLSELLAEQVLGRGLRLPFGAYTGIQLLDTLEVIAHEKFEELLKKKNGLNEDFVDYRTRAVLRRDASGRAVVTRVRETVDIGVSVPDLTKPFVLGTPAIVEQGTREAVATTEAKDMKVILTPKRIITIPRVLPMNIKAEFSLSDITDLEVFRALGRRISADPEGELRRVVLGVRIDTDESGFKQVVMTTEDAADKISASTLTIPLDSSSFGLRDIILALPIVSAREDSTGSQRRASTAIVEALVEGLGADAERLLSAFFTRAAAELVNKVNEEYRRVAPKPTMSDVVRVVEFGAQRSSARATSGDRYATFSKAIAYEGWNRSLYSLEWFDSSTERGLANIVDGDDAIDYWVRLHVGELSIIWTSEGRQYNADFIVREVSGDDWVVEVKADREVNTAEVQSKRDAATRWVARVNNSGEFKNKWHYLLVTEADVRMATGSWAALRKLGT